MTKIIGLRLEIPAHDDVRTQDVKRIVADAVRALGRRDNVGPEPDGVLDLGDQTERSVFFEGASVVTWVSERKPAARAANGRTKP